MNNKKTRFLIFLFLPFTVYAQSISVKSTACVNGDFIYGRHTFTVKGSDVIEKMELLESNKVTAANINKYSNCIVVDSLNWQCGDIGSDKKTVVNGKFFFTRKEIDKPNKNCNFNFKMEQIN
jgi:hypothetical protein